MKVQLNPTKSFKTKINKMLKEIQENHELSYSKYKE